MTMSTLIKEKYLIGVASLWFRDSVHCHHGGEHGSIRADVVLELRVLYLDQKAAGSQLIVTLREA